MRKIREVLRLRAQRLSDRKIALSGNLSRERHLMIEILRISDPHAESVTMKRLAEQVPRHQSAVVALAGECTSSTEKLGRSRGRAWAGVAFPAEEVRE